MAAADTSPFQGIVGNLSSGKSALVHRYLTGTYVQEESPEGELQLLLPLPPCCLRTPPRALPFSPLRSLPQVADLRRRSWWMVRATCC